MKFGTPQLIRRKQISNYAESFASAREMKLDWRNNFDLQDTTIIDDNTQPGAFTASCTQKFVIDDRLMTDNVTALDDFEEACVIDNTVFVGASKMTVT